MFGNTIYTLPSCANYMGAVRIFERARTPRSKNWPEGTRPLKGTRDPHYAVIKDGDKVVFRLHRTNVVEWHGPTSMTLDSSYDSISTRDFANRFLPGGICFIPMKEEGQVIALYDQRFIRGQHTFALVEERWEVTSPIVRPRRRVLNKDAAAVVNEKLKDFFQWIRSIWAVAGNGANHPWVGAVVIPPATRIILNNIKPEDYIHVALHFVPYENSWTGGSLECRLTTISADNLIAMIRQRLYEQENCYIRIDYDAPVPRRTTTKEKV